MDENTKWFYDLVYKQTLKLPISQRVELLERYGETLIELQKRVIKDVNDYEARKEEYSERLCLVCGHKSYIKDWKRITDYLSGYLLDRCPNCGRDLMDNEYKDLPYVEDTSREV